MFKRIHHVAIICQDYDRSKHFYCTILGAKILQENYRADRRSYKLDLMLADCQIELFSFPNPPKRLNNPEAAGLRHLAFTVDSVTTVKHILEASNISVEPIRTDPYTRKKFTFFKDPDGLPLEIYES